MAGWDPIFEYDGKQTYAEMDKEEKVRTILFPAKMPRAKTSTEQDLAPVQGAGEVAAVASRRPTVNRHGYITRPAKDLRRMRNEDSRIVIWPNEFPQSAFSTCDCFHESTHCAIRWQFESTSESRSLFNSTTISSSNASRASSARTPKISASTFSSSFFSW